jgi:uncharacterized membrane protein
LFVDIIWINHHRLLLFAHDATPKLIWWNFAHLFMTSLIPFATAWIYKGECQEKYFSLDRKWSNSSLTSSPL